MDICTVDMLGENVAGRSPKDIMVMNRELRLLPYELDGSDISWCNRKRLFWASFEVDPDLEDVTCIEKEDRTVV